MRLPRTILVPTDFSEFADHALAYAVDLAVPLDATLHLMHVLSISAPGLPELGVAHGVLTMEASTSHAQQALDALVAQYRDRVSIATVIEIGDARDLIDRIALTIGAGLIVMGTHGRRGVRRALLGSVAESVLRSAPCPVLTVPTLHPVG